MKTTNYVHLFVVLTVTTKYCTGFSISVRPIDGKWGTWQNWYDSKCKGQCGKNNYRIITYRRKCDNPPPSEFGTKCSGSSVKTATEFCKMTGCEAVHGGWSSWTQHQLPCSVTCETGLMNISETRMCNRPMPKNGGRQCRGLSERMFETECFTDTECPVDGGWGVWRTQLIGACSTSCGKGSQTVRYTRYCNSPAPAGWGKFCSGNNTKTITLTCSFKCDGQSSKEFSLTVDVIILVIGIALIFLMFITVTYVFRQHKRRGPLIEKGKTIMSHAEENPALST